MSDRPAIDFSTLSLEQLDALLNDRAAADADEVIGAMIEAIRRCHEQARASVEQMRGSRAPRQMLAEARSRLQQATEAAEFMEQAGETYRNLHRAAFMRGALWILRNSPQKTNE